MILSQPILQSSDQDKANPSIPCHKNEIEGDDNGADPQDGIIGFLLNGAVGDIIGHDQQGYQEEKSGEAAVFSLAVHAVIQGCSAHVCHDAEEGGSGK